MNKVELKTVTIFFIMIYIFGIGIWFAVNFPDFNETEGVGYFILSGMLVLIGFKYINHLIYKE